MVDASVSLRKRAHQPVEDEPDPQTNKPTVEGVCLLLGALHATHFGPIPDDMIRQAQDEPAGNAHTPSPVRAGGWGSVIASTGHFSRNAAMITDVRSPSARSILATRSMGILRPTKAVRVVRVALLMQVEYQNTGH